MAEEVEMTPVDAAAVPAEPPKVNPLAKPAAPTALKPGLKLPPKPGATILAKPGLKLPPKPGATLGVKPGLKLPPKPGATLVAKPMIRKPGMGGTVVGKPLPKPVQAVPAPAPAAAAPAPAPAAPAAAPAGETSLEALKSVTQKLKGVTQQIPQQAVLHKTGIIAEAADPNAAPTDAQKEAAKHKTARISLSEAIGVAPVKSEPAPMKTIRIKRPINLPTQPPSAETAPAGEAAPAAAEPAAEGTSITQRKTLKITRPGATVRPAGKFGVKKPGATVAAPKADAPAGGDVADIPEIPDMPADTIPSAIPPMPIAAEPAKAGPLTMVAVLVGLAACIAVGALAFYLYGDAQLPTYCGGLGWAS